MLKNGANINSRDNQGQSVLFFVNNNNELAEYLIEKGVEMNVIANDGKTALHVACERYNSNSNLDLVKTLVVKGTDINVKDCQGKTVLDVAIERGLTKIVRFLNNNDFCF